MRREKSFLPVFFKGCIDRLFDNLQSGKKEIIVLEKGLEKVLNFGFKSLYKPCLDKWSLVEGGYFTWRVNCIFIFQTPEVHTQSSDYSVGAQPVVKVQPINGNRQVISNGIAQSGDMENGVGELPPVIRAPAATSVRSFPGDLLIGVNNSFATLETGRELGPKCNLVPGLFPKKIWEGRPSHFFLGKSPGNEVGLNAYRNCFWDR